MVKHIFEYPKITIEPNGFFADEDDTIVIQEKIDGANFRFALLRDGLWFGSREHTIEASNHRFAPCCEEVRRHAEGLEEYEGLVFVGECCVPHRLQYRWDEIPPFLGYDVYDPYLGEFRADADVIFGQLGLPIAPVIRRCKAGNIRRIEEDMIPQSAYADAQAEGLVFKNYNKQHFFKFVRSDFAEKVKTKKDFGVATHLTTARVEKMIYKLVDEGMSIGEEMLPVLMPRVAQDIIDESGTKKDLKAVEKEISGFTYRVLAGMEEVACAH